MQYSFGETTFRVLIVILVPRYVSQGKHGVEKEVPFWRMSFFGQAIQ